MTIRSRGLRRQSIRSKLAAGAVAVLLGLGGAVIAAQPAGAATCSTLSRAGDNIVGSCTGYPSFTIEWTCYWSPQVNTKTFKTSAAAPGMSFNFFACDSGVYYVGIR